MIDGSASQRAPVDLAIEGGTVVLPTGPRKMNVLVEDGRIVEIGTDRRAARTHHDATGLIVLPGFVDAHVHCMEQVEPAREDWDHACRAALAAGATTLIEHTHAAPVRTAPQLRSKRAWLEGRATVDYAFAAHAWPGRPSDAVDVWLGGAAYLKVFTCTTHGVEGFDSESLAELFAATAPVGATCLVHCEDQSVLDDNERRLHASDRTDGWIVPCWRSLHAERSAVEQVLRLAVHARADVVIAHASSPAIVDAVRGARALGASVAIETCPQYLTLLETEVGEQGALRKFTPPARARDAAELALMWDLLRNGAITYVSSDHAPATREQKRAGTIWDAPFGLPGLDTTSAIMIDAACNNRIAWRAVAEVYARSPARVYGLAGKGSLEPGYDADLVLVDPAASWTLTDSAIRSKAGWSPYAGRALRGRVVATIRGGRVVHDVQHPDLRPSPGRFLAGRGAIGV